MGQPRLYTEAPLRQNTPQDLNRLCQRLGYQFSQSSLLNEALTHSSFASTNYERLEFLGDSALNFVIAAELYRREKTLDEGSLSRLRATLVRGTTLSEIARELELGQYLQLGSGELKAGGFDRDSILADAVEAIIGAILEDAGFDACRDFILALFSERLEQLPTIAELKDPKTRLQEALQGAGLPLPLYEVVETSGKAHERSFTVRCQVEALDLEVSATSSSRRKAEQLTAAQLLSQPGITGLNA